MNRQELKNRFGTTECNGQEYVLTSDAIHTNRVLEDSCMFEMAANAINGKNNPVMVYWIFENDGRELDEYDYDTAVRAETAETAETKEILPWRYIMENLKVAEIGNNIITLDLQEKTLYYNNEVIEDSGNWTTIDNYYDVIKKIYGKKAKIIDFEELLVGLNIEDIATKEELVFTSSNEYGTTDVSIGRNILNIPSDEWVNGISTIMLEFDDDGIITHQYNNI